MLKIVSGVVQRKHVEKEYLNFKKKYNTLKKTVFKEKI